jgi:hypothetical protein
MLTTIFGGFFAFLITLRRAGHFANESLICFNHQWEVQEGCATYAGMAIVANEGSKASREAESAAVALPIAVGGVCAKSLSVRRRIA